MPEPCSTCLLIASGTPAPGYPHTCGKSHRNFEVTFARPCKRCGGTKGRGVYEYWRGLIVRDTWVCECGAVFYSWEWGSNMLAAKEWREWEAQQERQSDQRPGVTGAEPKPTPPTPSTVERAKMNEEVAREVGHWPDGSTDGLKPKPKEQLSLW